MTKSTKRILFISMVFLAFLAGTLFSEQTRQVSSSVDSDSHWDHAGSTVFTGPGITAIGIGTAAPTTLFDVNKSDVGGNTVIRLKNNDNTNISSAAVFDISVGGTSGGDPFLQLGIPGSVNWFMGLDNSDGDKMKFGLNGPGSSDFMTINTSGNVGIGTASPSEKLDINGNINLSGANPKITAAGEICIGGGCP